MASGTENFSPIEEAMARVRQCAEPRPAGDQVGAAILRASRRLGLSFTRTKDFWYGDARRIDAAEMDRLRHVAEKKHRTRSRHRRGRSVQEQDAGLPLADLL
jgi:hypothetical protein